jgi:hypothetical protein
MKCKIYAVTKFKIIISQLIGHFLLKAITSVFVHDIFVVNCSQQIFI